MLTSRCHCDLRYKTFQIYVQMVHLFAALDKGIPNSNDRFEVYMLCIELYVHPAIGLAQIHIMVPSFRCPFNFVQRKPFSFLSS